MDLRTFVAVVAVGIDVGIRPSCKIVIGILLISSQLQTVVLRYNHNYPGMVVLITMNYQLDLSVGSFNALAVL